MLSIVILLSFASAAFIYLVAQTYTVILAEQLEHIKGSGTLMEFVLRRFPFLFIPVVLILPSFVCGVSELINPTNNPVTPFILLMGFCIALTQGNKFRDRARMLMADG